MFECRFSRLEKLYLRTSADNIIHLSFKLPIHKVLYYLVGLLESKRKAGGVKEGLQDRKLTAASRLSCGYVRSNLLFQELLKNTSPSQHGSEGFCLCEKI